MVAQLTTEVRSGKELSQKPEWRRVSVDFTVHSFIAAQDLNKWPKLLRPVVHWFLSSCRKVRADIEEARAIYTPVVEVRMAKKREAIANGEKPPMYNDMIDWLDELSKGCPFDAAMAQMMIAQAMIHGTADLTTQTLFDICERPQLVEDLRAEILSVIGKEGLTQASLSKLHLMDSVVKESQRLKPLFLGRSFFPAVYSFLCIAPSYLMTDILPVTMKRYAQQSITLSDGVVIPKDSMVVVSMQNMWDESRYPNPHEFQSDRFLKQRQVPGQEAAAQLSSATVDHMGFGFGRHGCPGRFYAAALIKLTLCHIVSKYDLRLVGGSPAVLTQGVNLMANYEAEIEVRRRQEEIVL
jgi:hypothetical protein